jgi:hypothetical protein
VIDLKATGIEAVITKLRNIADVVPDKARKTMHRGADKIVKEAKLNTPVDTHALEDSIHKEVAYGARGRLEIDIVAGEGLEYAQEVHEHYESMKPGKATLAKMAANPDRIIGSKFLERALQEQEPKLHADMIVAIDQEVQK